MGIFPNNSMDAIGGMDFLELSTFDKEHFMVLYDQHLP